MAIQLQRQNRFKKLMDQRRNYQEQVNTITTLETTQQHYPIKEIMYFILSFTKKHKDIFKALIKKPELYHANDHLKMRETY